MKINIIDIAQKFSGNNEIESINRLGNGLINDTYLVVEKETVIKYVLQKINKIVFVNPEKVMNNLIKISDHLNANPDTSYFTISLKRSYDNQAGFEDENKDVWRAFDYLDNTLTLSNIENQHVAYEAARAYGNFIRRLSDLDTESIVDTIENFHNYPDRLLKFEKSLEVDFQSRSNHCFEEITKVKSCYHYINDLKSLSLPNRIIHSDTKVDNILFNRNGDKALMVIDLDIAMNGPLLYDFGDMVRSFANATREDDPALENIKIRKDILAALIKGYLEETRLFITEKEKSTLHLGPLLVTYIQAVRNLTDYLNGDIYYKVDYPEHNLVRTKNQLRFLELLENNVDFLKEIIANSASKNQ